MSNGTIGVKTCGLRLRQIVVMVQWDARNNDRVQRTPDSPQRMSCQCYGFQMMIIKKLPTYFLIFLLFFYRAGYGYGLPKERPGYLEVTALACSRV